jgi:2-amino-4-hydroxy-6-hydroxymethyldihydropteridine diphosphokinase
MQELYLLLGSNVGNRLLYIEKAKNLIAKEIGIIIKESFIYESDSWGKTDNNNYLNQALMLYTNCNPVLLLEKLKKLEAESGRTLFEKWGPREIDIDILLFGNLVYETQSLSIPHKYLSDRKFALIPLNDIASEVIHPINLNSIKSLLADCTDNLSVRLLQKNYEV